MLLDEMPNVVVEFGAVIAELGRQPRMAKQFFTKYQDRILFGKDSGYPKNMRLISVCLKRKMNIFPIIKNTMLSGPCTEWAYPTSS